MVYFQHHWIQFLLGKERTSMNGLMGKIIICVAVWCRYLQRLTVLLWAFEAASVFVTLLHAPSSQYTHLQYLPFVQLFKLFKNGGLSPPKIEQEILQILVRLLSRSQTAQTTNHHVHQDELCQLGCREFVKQLEWPDHTETRYFCLQFRKNNHKLCT